LENPNFAPEFEFLMKIAFLSDIHGNLSALDAVIETPIFKECEQFFFLGDFIGYYFEPKKVLDRLRGLEFEFVLGNHEELLLQNRNYPEGMQYLTEKYGIGHSIAVDELSEEDFEWLKDIPRSRTIEVNGFEIVLCHGFFNDCDMHVYPDTNLINLVDAMPPRVRYIFMGNTHYPMNRSIGGVKFINPGSVGQPRNGQKGASWGYFDTVSETFSNIYTHYDQESVAKQAEIRDPMHHYLAEVLRR